MFWSETFFEHPLKSMLKASVVLLPQPRLFKQQGDLSRADRARVKRFAGH